MSPWSQITAQFNLFNSGSGSGSGSSPPAASTAGRRLLQNSSFADFAPEDTITSDLTKGGKRGWSPVQICVVPQCAVFGSPPSLATCSGNLCSCANVRQLLMQLALHLCHSSFVTTLCWIMHCISLVEDAAIYSVVLLICTCMYVMLPHAIQ